ncbi:hypothetical protein C8R43DRAFT_967552 [Mycena crocata]|nr:hypothetical protein C8R43DRAFT_967552 [Mycena crocata]
MPSIFRILAVLLLVGGTALASPIVGRNADCIDEKTRFACSIQEAEAVRSGTMARPDFLAACCAKNSNQGSAFRQDDESPVSLDTAQNKNTEKADVKVDEPARQQKPDPASAIQGLANKEKVDVDAVEPSTHRQGTQKTSDNTEVDVHGSEHGSFNSNHKGDVDIKEANAEPALSFNPAQRKGDEAEVDLKGNEPFTANGNRKADTSAPKDVDVKETTANPEISAPSFDSAERKGGSTPAALKSDFDVKKTTANKVSSPSFDPAQSNGDSAKVDVKGSEPVDTNSKTSSTKVNVKEKSKVPAPSSDPAQSNGDNAEVDVVDSGNSNTGPPIKLDAFSKMPAKKLMQGKQTEASAVEKQLKKDEGQVGEEVKQLTKGAAGRKGAAESLEKAEADALKNDDGKASEEVKVESRMR